MKVKKNKKIKKMTGLVLRDSKDKTTQVLVEKIMLHPLYQKRFSRTKKILVHAEVDLKKGQQVIISETKPWSRHKSWQIEKVIGSKDQK